MVANQSSRIKLYISALAVCGGWGCASLGRACHSVLSESANFSMHGCKNRALFPPSPFSR